MYPVEIVDGIVVVKVPILVREPFDFSLEFEGAETQTSVPHLKENEFLVSELAAGQVKLVHLDGARVAVYNVDGQFYATQDECTHVDGPLSEGELEGAQIICPWHASCFDVRNGKATCGPAEEPLKTYRVTVTGDIGRVEG